MERIIRSLFQVGNAPDAEEALANWHKLQENKLGYPNEEDKRIYGYLETFYGSMSAPPDYSLIREFFEKRDDIEVCNRLEEIKKSQFYIRTNFLSLVRSELEQQQIKSFIIACRDAAAIAEHGRNLDKPLDGKKVIRGVQDAMGFMFEKMSTFSHFESGEKLEGLIEDDADEFLEEYDSTTKQTAYSGRNIFGLEPVDAAGDGHKSGEFWVHCAFPGELKCVPGHSTIFDHKTGKRRTFSELYTSGDLPIVTALEREGKSSEKLVFAQASHLIENGVRDVFTIHLESGRQVASTDNHKFFTHLGWKELKDIKDGDFLAVPKKFEISSPNTHWKDHEIKIIGYLIGHGFAGDKRPSIITTENEDARRDFVNCMKLISKDDSLDESMIYEKIVIDKKIPPELFGLDERQMAILLSVLWTSGCTTEYVKRDSKYGDIPEDEVECLSLSLSHCRDVQSLLLRIGVHSKIIEHRANYGGRSVPLYATRVQGDKSKSIFFSKVNVIGKEYRYNPVVESVEDRNGDIVWDKVTKISSSGREMTYDLSVPEHHSFVLDDVVSHNTSIALNYAYNNSYIFGKNIVYCIFEMPYKQLRRQLYVIHSSNGKFVTEWHKKDVKEGRPEPYIGLDYRKVRDGKLNELEFERLKIVAQDFKANCKGKLYVWRPPVQVGSEEVRKKTEMFHNKYGCDGIILDNIGNMKPKYRTNDFVTMINSIVTECRFLALNFARGNTVPVLGLFHMNRQGKLRADKAEGRYDSAAISYANQLEKDADVITYTYLNDQLRQQGQFYMGCIKNRDNPVFQQFTGRIFWQTKRMRAIESGLLDMSQDRILAASRQISLTVDDMIT